MFIYYAINAILNIGCIFVAQYFDISLSQSNWIVMIAFISIIAHFFILRGYKKLAFEPVTSENLNNINTKLSRLEGLRWFSNFVTPILCLIFFI